MASPCNRGDTIINKHFHFYRDKIMKQSCYFAKVFANVCDGKCNKKHNLLVSTHFHCNFVYMNKRSKFCVKMAKNLFPDVGVYFLKFSGR